MEMTKQFSRVGLFSYQEDRSMSEQEEYGVRLDRLTQNLENIAMKDHFLNGNGNSQKGVESRGKKSKTNY